MMKELAKKILRGAICLVLVCVLAFLVLFFRHLPGYLILKEPVSIAPPEDGGIRIMSCNVRCLTVLDLGKKSWFYRADKLLGDIEEESPGIVGFQEVTRWQYDYLVDTMSGYDSVITYRDNSIISEGCPVFYNTALYTLVDKGSFWLSETPEVMSRDWDSACYRICSYVILTDNASQKDFVVFNTHLDHVSDEARINGIGVVLDKIAQFGDLPAVIMGDLNAEEGSATYLSVTENFLDACYETENTTNAGTFQWWGELESGRRIDYFMISKTGFNVHRYCVADIVHDGTYASDHNPIVLDITLE